MRETNSPFHKMLVGAAAGLIATLPMTIFMQTVWLQLPRREMHPLPPRQITRRLLRRSGTQGRVNHRTETALTLFLHFLFGAGAGAMYAILAERLPGQRDEVKGTFAGASLWTGSYLGWIPALGILPPATQQPWRMNLLMIVAHFVWGFSWGVLTRMFSSRKQYIEL